MKRCFLFTNSVLSICPPTSSSLFFLFLPWARNVIHSSSIPLSSPSPFPYALCLNFHKTLAFSLQFLATMHSSCFTCDCWSFEVPCVRKAGSWARSLYRLRAVNTWEGFYLLSDVVDPGWRAVAQIRSLGLPDTIRCKTPESCNTCNRKVAVFSVTGCILPSAPCVEGFWGLISAQVLSRTFPSHLSVLVSHHLGPLRP